MANRLTYAIYRHAVVDIRVYDARSNVHLPAYAPVPLWTRWRSAFRERVNHRMLFQRADGTAAFSAALVS